VAKSRWLRIQSVNRVFALVCSNAYEPGEVVTRRIKLKTEYDKIADRVTAKK
jgi:hypothetical protein